MLSRILVNRVLNLTKVMCFVQPSFQINSGKLFSNPLWARLTLLDGTEPCWKTKIGISHTSFRYVLTIESPKHTRCRFWNPFQWKVRVTCYFSNWRPMTLNKFTSQLIYLVKCYQLTPYIQFIILLVEGLTIRWTDTKLCHNFSFRNSFFFIPDFFFSS
jgi:hypothetical protein